MRALIVDDEALARARLLRLLKPHGDVQIVGEAGDGVAALQAIQRLQPDLVFLDVQMPESSGFDVAASLPAPAPALVFVTAHDAYALRAFDAQAIDYLLKPVAPARLEQTLNRVRALLAGAQARPALAVAPLAPMAYASHPLSAKRLLIPDRGKTHLVSIDAIEALQSAENYVNVITAERTYLMRKTLADLLAHLGEDFVRIHRSHAVAVAQVQTIQSRQKGDALVVLHGGTQLPCSRRYREALTARLAESVRFIPD